MPSSIRLLFLAGSAREGSLNKKLARLAHDPSYSDGPIDVIGYAALIPEIIRGTRS